MLFVIATDRSKDVAMLSFVCDIEMKKQLDIIIDFKQICCGNFFHDLSNRQPKDYE